MTEYEKECVEVAAEIAENMLFDSEIFEVTKEVYRIIVPHDSLLRVVQELNACLKGDPQ